MKLKHLILTGLLRATIVDKLNDKKDMPLISAKDYGMVDAITSYGYCGNINLYNRWKIGI